MDERLTAFLNRQASSSAASDATTASSVASAALDAASQQLPLNTTHSSNNNKQRTIQVKIGNQAAKSMTPDQAAEYLQQLAGRGAFSAGREVKMTFGKGASETTTSSRLQFGPTEISRSSTSTSTSVSTTTATTTGSTAATATFGPKPPPVATDKKRQKHTLVSGTIGGNATVTATSRGGMSLPAGFLDGTVNVNTNAIINSDSIPLSALELAALAGDFGAGGARMANTRDRNNNNSTNNGSTSRRKDGMPCSEKEMKALMSMFVEIMGLQMNTDRLNKPAQVLAAKVPENLFSFPADLPPPPGGWPDDLLWPDEYRDDEQEDQDSLPDLEDITARESASSTAPRDGNEGSEKNAAAAANETQPQLSVTGVSGITAFEWEALERVAIDDALEQEERARKSAKKRDRKIRKSAAVRKEAAARLAEEKAKQWEKLAIQWRSRVAAQCQSNQADATKLAELLEESPLDDASTDFTKDVEVHLQFLIPHSVAKNRQQVEKTAQVRNQLLAYMLPRSINVVFDPLRNGRSAFHTACFFGDVAMVRQVLDQLKKSLADASTPAFVSTHLTSLCQDSGWSPLHYAVLSGSMHAIESLLRHGSDVKTVTNDTHTWRTSNGKGVTARQLVESVISGNYEKEIETHGMALLDSTSSIRSNSTERRRFLALLDRILQRLKNIEANGYSPMDDAQIAAAEKLAERSLQKQESLESEETSVSTSKKNKKKKKKGQALAAAPVVESKSIKPAAKSRPKPAPAPPATALNNNKKVAPKEESKDPLVAALLGMGFTEEQISAGVDACGGINRATADEVVMWIFQQQSRSEDTGGHQSSTNSQPSDTTDDRKPQGADINQSTRARGIKAAESKKQELAKLEEERLAAERLVAKREEQRRRNREWNNREQARQQQGAQVQVATGKNLTDRNGPMFPPTGLAPASHFVGTGKEGTLHATAPPIYAAALKAAPPSSAASIFASRVIDDTSTVASSVEHRSVEFVVNDDTTVSTMGSFQTRSRTPVLIQPSAPPGFAASATIPEVAAMEHQQPWNYHLQQLQQQQQQPLGDMRRQPPPHGMPSMVPPGIPQARPLLDNRLHGSALNGGHLGGMQMRMQPTQSGYAGGSGNYGMPPAGMNSSSFFGGPAPPPNPPPSGYNGMYGHGGQSPILPTVTSSVSGPTLSNPMDFDLDPHRAGPHRLDSSIIDSISTGSAVLGGASLWGNTSQSSGNAVGGSSLLGNVIHTNTLRQEQQQLQQLQQQQLQQQQESDVAFLNGNVNKRAPVGPTWQQQTGGGSIW